MNRCILTVPADAWVPRPDSEDVGDNDIGWLCPLEAIQFEDEGSVLGPFVATLAVLQYAYRKSCCEGQREKNRQRDKYIGESIRAMRCLDDLTTPTVFLPRLIFPSG